MNNLSFCLLCLWFCVPGLSVLYKSIGDCRFDPKNSHQCPQVVILCGSGSQAAYAVNCARQLASRRIHLTVFIPDDVQCSDGMDTEMKLLDLSGAKLKTSNYKSGLSLCVYVYLNFWLIDVAEW